MGERKGRRHATNRSIYRKVLSTVAKLVFWASIVCGSVSFYYYTYIIMTTGNPPDEAIHFYLGLTVLVSIIGFFSVLLFCFAICSKHKAH